MAKEPSGRNQLSLPFAMNVSQYMQSTDDFVNLLCVNHKYGRIEPSTRTNPKLIDSSYRVEIIDGSIQTKQPYKVERVFNSLETVSVYDKYDIENPESDINKMIRKVKRVKLCVILDEKRGNRIIQEWRDNGIEVIEDSIKYICDLEYDHAGDGTGIKELDPHCAILRRNRILEYDADDWRRFVGEPHGDIPAHLNYSPQPALDLSALRIREIGPYFFLNGRYADILLPTTVTKLGENCFFECGIQSIILPPNITSLDARCFSGCSVNSITLPLHLERIDNNCFFNCQNLISIDIPSSVTHIGMFCFSYCNLLQSIDIPNGVSELPEGCFNHCISLANIKLPRDLRAIGSTCFEDCSHLEDIVIPESVTGIGEYCFKNCRMLTSVNIPTQITRWNGTWFIGCTRMEEVLHESDSESE